MKSDCFLFAGFALLVAFSACSEGNNSSLGPSANEGSHPNFPTALLADTTLAACVRATAAQNNVNLDSAGLASLYELTARGRGIASLEGIGVLRNLRTLDLSENQIIDLHPLASLGNLREMDLSGNRVSDLSPIASLTQLEIVLLQGNLIRDPSPLLSLTRLTAVELKDNPLGATAQAALAALAARGVAVTADEPPATETELSPAGTYTLAFFCAPGAVYLIPYPKGESIPFYTPPGTARDLRWSPDGMTLACEVYLASENVIRIYLVSRTSGEAIITTKPPKDARDTKPCWSPNGDRLAFLREDPITRLSEIHTMTVATGEERWVTTDGSVDDLLWGPAEGSLTITQNLTLSLLDLKNGTKSFLAQALDAPDRKHTGGVRIRSWSADGTRLLLTGLLEGASAYGIYICHPPALPELVVENTDSVFVDQPAWSPDGARIVFSRYRVLSKTQGLGELVAYDLTTRAEQVILSSPNRTPGMPQWSPDGTVLVYCLWPQENTYGAIYVYSLADNTITQLTDETTPNIAGMAWAPR